METELQEYLNDGVCSSGGELGPEGPQGIQGEPGPEGPQGVTGEKGEPGPAFTLLGSKPTVSALPTTGTSGTGWIVEADGNVYTWNDVTSSWDGVGQIVGPQGIQGIQGTQGTQGPQGIQGTQGVSSVPNIEEKSTTGIVNPTSSKYTEIITTASVTRTLPTVSTALKGYILNIKNVSSGTISISGNIENVTGTTLSVSSLTNYQFQCSGTTWWII